jgi:hypothetical protein
MTALPADGNDLPIIEDNPQRLDMIARVTLTESV